MQLSFYARDDLKVTEPGIRRMAGAPPRYVGREFVGPSATAAAHHPATRTPFTCEQDSEDGRRLSKVCLRDGALWPANRETAAAVGVPFVDVEFAEGEWRAKAPPKSTAKPVKE